MKQIISLLAVFILLVPYANGQKLTFATKPSKPEFIEYNATDFEKKTSKFHLSSESKVGFGITGAGIIIGCIGIEKYRTNTGDNYSKNREANFDAGMWLVGGVIAIMGSVFSIDGGIHDMHRYYKEHRLSILILSEKQIGIAYNF